MIMRMRMSYKACGFWEYEASSHMQDGVEFSEFDDKMRNEDEDEL